MAAASKLKGRAAQGELTRIQVLDAAMDIIVNDGMRAVRHREVARRAGVSLGTTTYHFESIEDLIVSAFKLWRASRPLENNQLYKQLADFLAPLEGREAKGKMREKVAYKVCQLSIDYVCDQLTGKRQDRIVELAFYHESLRSLTLRELVLNSWQAEQAFLENVHRQAGSRHPEEDARITFSLFRQLELGAVIADLPLPNEDMIEATLSRHMSLCFGVDIKTRGDAG